MAGGGDGECAGQQSCSGLGKGIWGRGPGSQTWSGGESNPGQLTSWRGLRTQTLEPVHPTTSLPPLPSDWHTGQTY
jgi:hypothetical protein